MAVFLIWDFIYFDRVSERVYVAVRKEVVRRNPRSMPVIIACFVTFILISFFIMNAHYQLREELIEMLRQEKEVVETNNRLKTELASITQARMLELKTKEKLGLKKPKDEEVLVLR